jgi:hypothetical protein
MTSHVFSAHLRFRSSYFCSTQPIREKREILHHAKISRCMVQSNLDYSNPFGQGEISNRPDNVDHAYKNVYTTDLSSISMILISSSIDRTLTLRFFYFLER